MGIALKKPENVAGSALPAIIIGLFVAFGGVLYGYVGPLHQHHRQDGADRELDMTPAR